MHLFKNILQESTLPKGNFRHYTSLDKIKSIKKQGFRLSGNASAELGGTYGVGVYFTNKDYSQYEMPFIPWNGKGLKLLRLKEVLMSNGQKNWIPMMEVIKKSLNFKKALKVVKSDYEWAHSLDELEFDVKNNIFSTYAWFRAYKLIPLLGYDGCVITHTTYNTLIVVYNVEKLNQVLLRK